MANPLAEREKYLHGWRVGLAIFVIVSLLYGLVAVQLKTGWEGWLQLGLYLSAIAGACLGIPLTIHSFVQRNFPGKYCASSDGLLLVHEYLWGERAEKVRWSEVWKVTLTPRPGWVRVAVLPDRDREQIARSWRPEKVAREDRLMTIEVEDRLWRQVRDWVPAAVRDAGEG